MKPSADAAPSSYADVLEHTVVRPACDRPDLGPEFRTWLKEFVSTLDLNREGGRLAA